MFYYNYFMEKKATHSLIKAIHTHYQQLIPRIQHLPPTGSRPLTVQGRVAGWATAKATRVLEQQDGVTVLDESVSISDVPEQSLSIDDVLQQCATALQEAGLLRTWRNELLDVIGEGEKLSVIERAAVRPLGMLTKAVHLNAWTADGRMWIARRASNKTTDPGLWDTLVGGLAGAGESLDTSLLRECDEEAGLSSQNLQERTALRTLLRMHRRLPEGYQVEDVLSSDCILDDSITPNNKDGEVSEFQLVSVDELWSMLEQQKFTLEAELVILDALARHFSASQLHA